MTDHTHKQPPSTRLVNTDALSTQELRMVRASGGDTREMPRLAAGSPHRGMALNRPPLGELLMKAFVTIFAATTLFGLAAAVVLAIIVPPWYQGLTPSQQAIWCNRVTALCNLADKPDSDVLAVDNSQVDSEAALALLGEPSATPTADIPISPTPTLTIKGSNNASTVGTGSTDGTPIPPPSTATPAPTAIAFSPAASLALDRLSWEEQGWNNCGPTTITIGLSFYGYGDKQSRAAQALKPNLEDKNVSPQEMVRFVNEDVAQELSVRALWRVGGTPELVKALVDAGFPVIVERGIDVVESGWMGHYSLIVGYDEHQDIYLLYDSYFGHGDGQGRRESQSVIHTGWQHFNHTFIVLYNPGQESQLEAVLGDYMDEAYAAQQALERARAAATASSDDKWAWFNMGTSLTLLGRYEEATLAFDRARTLDLPFRMLWYQFGPYEAYYQQGRYDDVLALTLANERQTPYVEEVYYYRGLVYAARSETEAAVREFDKALRYNRYFEAAQQAKQAVLEGRFSPPQ